MAKVIFNLDDEDVARGRLRLVIDKSLIGSSVDRIQTMWDGANFSWEDWVRVAQAIDSKIEERKKIIENLKAEKQGSSPLFTDTRIVIKTLEESAEELELLWEETQEEVNAEITAQAKSVLDEMAKICLESLPF